MTYHFMEKVWLGQNFSSLTMIYLVKNVKKMIKREKNNQLLIVFTSFICNKDKKTFLK